ncbi:longitudinals lacking protein, isoforms H/M/V isoform X2 [Rhagoletis pomonella]|uniref:longitudinals lacking protein, isoforms H/M/V isoform X2 n=1 Tax=Rhagoletis pomonella TaxID=28610 RepID=UPI001786EF8D|nr:longitudinals lacking protein, isoforms H/M/V isoform X2 [Rhagoletis pomonella]
MDLLIATKTNSKKINAIMLPQQYCLRWKYHHSNLQTMFSQLLDRGCFCDVTLACEGQLIRAHRVVLCACSSFFDTVLTNYASERDPIIIMKDVTFADVKCLIEFMYKGEINVEHASLASLLKTADDLKIKGLAEVSWRDDDDGPPLPTAATEFHSPTLVHDMYGTRLEQQRIGSPGLMDQQHPTQPLQRERKLSSPKASTHAQQRLPTLTPIPSMNSVQMAAAAAAAAAAAVTSAASPVEHYLGPKRKRGRPPLDDAYDVFNVRKLAHYGGLEAHHHHHQAYLEAQRHYSDEQRRLAVISPIPPSSSSTSAAAVAYHQHIQQQQHNKRMRQLQRQQQQQLQQHHHQLRADVDDVEQDDAQADPEWITSNLEVNVGGGGDSEPVIECDNEASLVKEQKADVVIDEKDVNPMVKLELKKRKERTSEERESALTRKRSNGEERKDSSAENGEHEREEQQLRERVTQSEVSDQPSDRVAGAEEDEQQQAANVPQPVEEMESVRQTAEKTSSASATNAPFASSGSHKRASVNSEQIAPPPPPPPSLHHGTHGYNKYAPEGYLLNEHGMLITHDFVHAPTAAVPSTGATASSSSGVVAAANGNDQEYVDIKMEEYDGTELRLTTEEMSEWQDVIKMDDYLAKGRRPQFWEEPFTRRVLDAIKNKRLEMKKAARILGVSYGTLYGRYREVYGCLKHPYSTTFRPSQTNQLAVQPRFDMVWPSPKRDSGLMPGQLEIGKIRPKDLSELWTRPQI